MLPDARLLSLCLTLLASACSNLPPKSYPPFTEQRVDARFVVGEDGRLMFPATSRDLVVMQLETTPAPLAEGFVGDAGRWFGYTPGTTVTLRATVRVYGADDGAARKTLDAALHSAQSVAVDPHPPRDL